MKRILPYAITMWLGMASEGGEDSKERSSKDHKRAKGKQQLYHRGTTAVVKKKVLALSTS